MTVTQRTVFVGDRIWFEEERLPYTVQAVSPDGRWIAATKPFAVRRTVLYTVVDVVLGLRGRDNYGSLGYETPEDCVNAIAMFHNGDAEHSRRYKPIPLKVRKHVQAPVSS